MQLKILAISPTETKPLSFLKTPEVAESVIGAAFGISAPITTNSEVRAIYSNFLQFLLPELPLIASSIALDRAMIDQDTETLQTVLDTIQGNPNLCAITYFTSHCLGRPHHAMGIYISHDHIRVFSDGQSGTITDRSGTKLTLSHHKDSLIQILLQPNKELPLTLTFDQKATYTHHRFSPFNAFNCAIEAQLSPLHYLNSTLGLNTNFHDQFFRFIHSHCKDSDRDSLAESYQSLCAGHRLANRRKQSQTSSTSSSSDTIDISAILNHFKIFLIDYQPAPQSGIYPTLPASELRSFKRAHDSYRRAPTFVHCLFPNTDIRYSKPPLVTALDQHDNKPSLWDLCDPARHKHLKPVQFHALLLYNFSPFFKDYTSPEFLPRFEAFTTSYLNALAEDKVTSYLTNLLIRYVCDLMRSKPSRQIRKVVHRLVTGMEQQKPDPHVRSQLKVLKAHLFLQDSYCPIACAAILSIALISLLALLALAYQYHDSSTEHHCQAPPQ